MLSWGEAVIGGVMTGTAITGIYAINNATINNTRVLSRTVKGQFSSWRAAGLLLSYIAGLIIIGFVLAFSDAYSRLSVSSILDMPWYLYLISGLLLGFGTQVAGSCVPSNVHIWSRLYTFIIALVTGFIINNLVHGGFSYVSKGDKTAVAGETLVSNYNRDVSIGLCVGFPVLMALVGYAKYHYLHQVDVASHTKKLYWLSALSLLIGGMMMAFGFGLGGMLQQGKTIGALSLYVYWNPHCWIYFATALAVTIIGMGLTKAFGGPLDDPLPETVMESTFVSQDITNLVREGQEGGTAMKNNLWLTLGAIMVGLAWGMIGWLVGPMITMIPRIFADSKSFFGVFAAYFLSFVVGVWIHVLVRRFVMDAHKDATRV